MEGALPKPNMERAVKTLSLAIAQRTCEGEKEAFARLFDVLRGAFPLVYETAEIQAVSDTAMLLRFAGSQSVEPLLFTGHLDVVPVSAEAEAKWDFPPYSGVVSGGYVWGRGAIDMKGHVIALLEALEEMLESGYHFEREIWIALSGDQEVRGTDAQQMFRILKAQGVRPAFVLDEGMGIMEGQWGIEAPMAMIGVGEKGHINLTVSATAMGGHGSSPPKATALEKVIRGVMALVTLPLGLKHLSPSLMTMLSALAPHQKGFRRFAFSHPKLLKPYVFSILMETDFGRTFLMTTAAVTTARGSTAVNTLPDTASVMVNCRIVQGDTVQKVKKRAELRLRQRDVTLLTSATNDPSRMSPAGGPAWDALLTAISVHFKEAIPVPCVIPGASDARRYEGLCDHVYRFSPFELPLEEQRGKHGVNERLSLQNIEKGIRFFRQMLKV